MEHIDALEAVRRLTLERDALAEQVRRLEGEAEYYQRIIGAPQAPERREHPETGRQAGEVANVAPRETTEPQKWDGLIFGGCVVQLKEQYNGTQTCEGCKHWDTSTEYEGGYHDCHRHAPTAGSYNPRWPRTTRMSQCGDWEGK